MVIKKFGFTKDENNLKLKEAFKNESTLKQVHIDIYSESPLESSSSFMLLLRTSERNVNILNDNNRIILKKNDTYKTQFMNVLFSEIKECFVRITEGYFDFILKIQNIYYKVTILN